MSILLEDLEKRFMAEINRLWEAIDRIETELRNRNVPDI